MKKGGSGRGESCSFNSLPSSSSPSSRRRRGARGLEHTARAAPAPPSLRPRGAGPARAPRAPPRLRAAQALPVFGGAADPGGVGEIGGEKTARGTGPGERRVHSGSWGWGGVPRSSERGGGVHEACRRRGEDVKGACKRAKGGRRNEAAGKGGGVRKGCSPGHPGAQSPRPLLQVSPAFPLDAQARPILASGPAGGGGGGVDAAAPPPGTTPPFSRRESASPGTGETEEGA